MKEKYQSRFQRWQKRANRYITTINSTILALSVGALGFFINSIKDRGGFKGNVDIALSITVFGILVLSGYYGISVMINRLSDFRKTVNIIRKRMDGARDTDLKGEREELIETGRKTHTYLDNQIVFFALSIFIILLIKGWYLIT